MFDSMTSDQISERLGRIQTMARELDVRARRSGDLAAEIQLLLGEVVDAKAGKRRCEQRRQETLSQLNAALEVVQAAEKWDGERPLPATAAEHCLKEQLARYRDYCTHHVEQS